MKKLLAFLYFVSFMALNLLPLASTANAAGANLISNPSVETVSSSNSSLPQDWQQGGWGTNTASFSYQTTGEDGSRSLKLQVSSYTNGDAKWYFNPVAITGGSQYTFSDYYQSTISSDLVAQFDNGAGSYTYADLGSQAVSSAWKPISLNFTAPAAAKNVTIFHLISGVGSLTTDNFSLSNYSAPAAPTVSISAPAASASVSGTVTLSANASDSTGVAGVQFKVDGVNLGTEVTSSPYQLSWDSNTVSNGSHSLTAVARNTGGVTTTSAAVTVNVSNAVTPGTNLISNPSFETANSSNSNLPLNWSQGGWGNNTATYSYANTGHTGSRSASINMTAYTTGDAKWYFSPVSVTAGTVYNFSDYYQSNVATDLMAQFDNGSGSYSYVDLGSQAASSAWKQASVSFTAPATAKFVTIFHLINSVGSLQIDDSSLSVSTAPSVSVSSPAANATVSGTVSLTANASAAAGVKSVQFKVDGVNQGVAVTASPYQTSWDTTKVTAGTHSITAVVTSTDNKTATSAAVSVNVSNQVAGSNSVPNPSLETANPANTKLPQNWSKSSWGTNTTTFSYLNTGHTGVHSVKTQITKYTSGSAYWYSTDIPVTGGQLYDYVDYYQSNVISEIDAAVNMSDGSVQYMYLGDPSPSPNSWTKFETQFTMPAGAVSVSFDHNIYSVGWLTTDDYSLKTFAYQGFARPIVSLTFDDGYESFYNNGLPLLQKYGLKSTDYIITGVLGNDPSYMTSAQVKSLYTSGQEVGSHTVTHPDLTTLTAAKMDAELKNSQTTLQSLLGVPIKDFASPYGATNTQVVTDAMKYYSEYRGVQAGFNAKNNFDVTNIQVQNMLVTTTLAQVQAWVQQAQATNTWLVLVYHQVDPTLTDQTAEPYNTYPTDLDAQLSYIKSSGIAVETVAQALAEITPQIGK